MNDQADKSVAQLDLYAWDRLEVDEWLFIVRNRDEAMLGYRNLLMKALIEELEITGPVLRVLRRFARNSRIKSSIWMSLGQVVHAYDRGHRQLAAGESKEPRRLAYCCAAIAASYFAIARYQLAMFYAERTTDPKLSAHERARAIHRQAEWQETIESTPFDEPRQWRVGPSRELITLAAHLGSAALLADLQDQADGDMFSGL